MVVNAVAGGLVAGVLDTDPVEYELGSGACTRLCSYPWPAYGQESARPLYCGRGRADSCCLSIFQLIIKYFELGHKGSFLFYLKLREIY